MNYEQQTQEQLVIVPITAYIKQLEQQASALEWEGKLDECDAILDHLGHVRHYQLQTGSLYYPLF